jgi:glycosyltransferase involved in cell wall biosynthesis
LKRPVSGATRIADPRVTVCIPTYARTQWLAEAIESVLAQTFRDFVLLIGDDATPGDTVRPVVEAFDDPRISFVRFEDNAGIVGNFNRLLELSETDYVLQIGDDDALHPELLASAVAVLDSDPRIGLVHTRFDLIDGGGRVLEADTDWTGGLDEDAVEPGARFLSESMLHSCRVCASTAVLRRWALPPWGFREEDAPPFDFGCWLEMTRDWDFAFIARSLCRYRVHEGSFTSAQADATESGYLHRVESVVDARRVKQTFLERHYPPGPARRRLERLAHRAVRLELVIRVRQATLPERRLRPTASGLARLVRAERSLIREPAAWALLAGSLVGQRGVDALRRLLPARSPR